MHRFMTAALIMLTFASAASAQYRSHRHYRNSFNNTRNSMNYVMVPAGTSVSVRLDSNISTDNVQQGDAWNGTVTQNVVTNNGVAIPAGSLVEGVVTNFAQGTHSTRAQLALGLRSVTVNGQSRTMFGEAQPVIAGTSRAKKLGAIAGGAAVGALLGHTVARDNHGTLIGGLVGGAAGYGLTRNAMRTLQLKPGTTLSFVTSENMMAQR